MDVKSTTQRAKQGFNLKFTSEDFWFTTNKKNVYVIAITTPDDQTIRVKSLVEIQNQIKRIGLIGGTRKLDWKVEVITPNRNGSSSYLGKFSFFYL